MHDESPIYLSILCPQSYDSISPFYWYVSRLSRMENWYKKRKRIISSGSLHFEIL
jgi:hypothetical protein